MRSSGTGAGAGAGSTEDQHAMLEAGTEEPVIELPCAESTIEKNQRKYHLA